MKLFLCKMVNVKLPKDGTFNPSSFRSITKQKTNNLGEADKAKTPQYARVLSICVLHIS